MNYAVVGHFAKDIVPGGHQLGGAVYYSGTQAARLGATVSLISSAEPDLDISSLDPGILVYLQAAPSSTIFENIYDARGNRTQYVRGMAHPLTPDNAPELTPPPDILHLGPLVGEVAPDYGKAYPSAKLAVAPQGWMRHINPDGRVTPKPWHEAQAVLSQAWANVFSEEDLGFDEAQIEAMAQFCPITVCTRNVTGATLFYEGKRIHIPVEPANLVDPTGAGDVFAASFFVRLYETSDPEAAVLFAHDAAARSIEGIGVSTVANRDEILARMKNSSQ